TGEYGVAAVVLGDVVDQLHDDDGLADAGAAEESDLAALQERLHEVDDLHAGLEHLRGGRLLIECGRLTMNGHTLFSVHRSKVVEGLADDVQHATERLLADGH